MTIEFFVPGKAAPGGSKRGFTYERKTGGVGVRMVDMGKGNAEWKALAALTARVAMADRTPMTGPLVLSVTFIRARPSYQFNTKGLIKPGYVDSQPTMAPDATKLLRALEDGMTPIVWNDDAQVVEQHVRKRYAEIDEATGAHVSVTEWRKA